MSAPEAIAVPSRWATVARNTGTVAVIAALGGVAGFAFARFLWA